MNETTCQTPSREQIKSIYSAFYGVVPLNFLARGDERLCPYIPGRIAREEVFGAVEFPAELYHDLMNYGFRRSGMYFYRPVCEACSECTPIRIHAGEYRPTKSQRRILRKNREIDVRVASPRFTKQKFSIYSDYLASQHNRGPDHSSSTLRNFLYTSPVRTLEFEYRLRRRLLAVGIVDICSRSLSSVYAFYDPAFSSKSLGTFSAIQEILTWQKSISCLGTFSAIQEILFCQVYNIPHYYLGFLVRDNPSMNYKARFKPHELLNKSFTWVRCQLA